MDRVYRCPICGKSYTSLKDMYMCAQACESKEKAAAAKIEQERAAAEEAIINKFTELEQQIRKFNKTYTGYSFEIVLKHEGKTLSSKPKTTPLRDIDFVNRFGNPPLNYKSDTNKAADKNKTNEKFATSLEDFLATSLGIDKPTPKAKAKARVDRKVIEDSIRELVDQDSVDGYNLLTGGNFTTEDLVKTLTDLGESLQDLGFEWE